METPNSSTSKVKEITNSQVSKEFKFSNWIFWTLAHTIALPFSFFFGFIAIQFLSFIGKLLPEIVASGLGYILWGAIFGGIIGLIQWFFLKKKISIATGWIFYSLLGIGVAEILGVLVLLIFNIDRNMDIGLSYGWLVWTLIYFVGGAITGYFQSSYLKKITPYFRIWILGSSLSWGLSTLIWTGIIRFVYINLIAIISGGIFFGILSALFLNNIIKRK